MSKDRMEQSWQRMKTQILAAWSGLEESDLKDVRGDLSAMVELIHARTGEEPAQIRRKMMAII